MQAVLAGLTSQEGGLLTYLLSQFHHKGDRRTRLTKVLIAGDLLEPRAPLSSGRSSESSGEGKRRRGSNREGQSPPPRELSDIGFGSSRRSLARQGFPSLRAGRGPRGPGSAASSGARSSEAPERYPPASQSPGGLAGARQISGQWHCRGLSPEIQPLAVRIVKDPVWFTRNLRRFT